MSPVLVADNLSGFKVISARGVRRKLSCEVCGQEVFGKPMKVIIEGAKLSVCRRCALLGEPYIEAQTFPKPAWRAKARPIPTRPKTADLPKGLTDLDIIEDYASRIRRRRERLKISQEDLAKRVKERLSIIQKIEMAKMIPDMKLARILEHVLKIKLLVPRAEPTDVRPQAIRAEGLTLGDIAQFKRKEEKISK